MLVSDVSDVAAAAATAAAAAAAAAAAVAALLLMYHEHDVCMSYVSARKHLVHPS